MSAKDNKKIRPGFRFGRLTVIGFEGTAGELGRLGTTNYWKCRCDCGKETVPAD